MNDDTALPFATRKMNASTAGKKRSKSASKSSATGFDLTEIFDQLSAISKDIGKSLDGPSNKPVAAKANSNARSKETNTSLRQMAMKNAKLLAAAAASTPQEEEAALRDVRELDEKLEAMRNRK